jgi:DNA-binding transcriptional LysR family regulator
MVQVAPALSANSNDSVLQLALTGLGIVRLNDFVVGTSLPAGALVPVLKDFHCADKVPMHALYLHERHRLPRVAAMLDFLAESFSYPRWNAAAKVKPRKN